MPLSEEENVQPVVVRFAALGDVVLLTVLLDALAKRYGQPVAVLSSGAWTQTLLENDPAVAEVKLVTSRRAPYWLSTTQHEAVAWLRRKNGPVYLCDPDDDASRLVERAVSKDRIIRVWDRWPGIGAHWADWWHRVGAATELRAGSGQPRLAMPSFWLEDARSWLRRKGWADQPLLLIQPGNKKTAKMWSHHRKNDKYWPPERWAKAIRDILALKGDLRVLICGSPRERALAEGIASLASDERVVSVANHLPLPRLVALSSIAHSMISIDTGPAHVAAAMDCPAVVLFGRHGWQRWQPRAPRSTVIALGGREFSEEGTVLSIDVEQVVDAWRRLPPRAIAKAGNPLDSAGADRVQIAA